MVNQSVKQRKSRLNHRKKSANHKPDGTYEAETILDVAYVKNVPFFKVKWHNYTVEQCTWEPENHLINFKPQIKRIIQKTLVKRTYDNMKDLYLNSKKYKEQIVVKTEELDKKKHLGNRRRVSSVSTSNEVKQKMIKEDQYKTMKIVRVIDLQQVFHKQTNKVHLVVLAQVQMTSVNKKIREGNKWIHLDDVRSDFESLSLLTNFLLEYVVYAAKVLYADDDDRKSIMKDVKFVH